MAQTILDCITTYSLQYSPNRVDKLCKHLSLNGYTNAAIADLGTLGGVVEFVTECKANNITPIIGCRFFICEFDSSNHNKYNISTPSILLSKNLDGWKKLVQLISAANTPIAWNTVPRLSLDEIREIVREKDIIAISGGPHSNLSTCIVNQQQFYSSTTLDEAKQYVHKDWVERCEKKILQYQETFGKENFYLEICNTDWGAPSNLLTRGLRWLSHRLNVPCVATTQPYYIKPEDAQDQRLLLCSKLGATFNNLELDPEDQFINRFFEVDTFTLKTHDELTLLNSPEEIANTNKIALLIEDYTIFSPPKLPIFDCPDGLSETEYLRKLCREGWKTKIEGVISEELIPKYVDRVKEELGVFEENNLAGYFLVMQDLIKAAHARGELTGLGRGCLSGDTFIYTSDAYDCVAKKIRDIVVGDKVFSSDGKQYNVVNTFKYPIANEELLKIKTYYGDKNGITVTKDHKILAIPTKIIEKRGIKDKKYDDSLFSDDLADWYSADSLKRGDWVYFPQVSIKDSIPLTIDLSKYSDGHRLTNDELYCYHIQHNYLANTINNTTKYNRFITIDEDFFYMLGVFVGDGWLLKHKDYIFGLAFNTDDNNKIDVICNYLDKLEVKYIKRFHNTKKLLQIEIYSAHIVRFIEDILPYYKRSSDTKYVPSMVFNTSKNNIVAFLNGYCSADGHDMPKLKKYKFSTTSKELCYQIKLLHSIINVPCGVSNNPRIDKRGYPDWVEYTMTSPYSNIDEALYFKKTDNGVWVRINSIESVTIDDKYVYDIEIDNELHNYLTTSCVVHNSAAGCMVSYLLNITGVDPIKYDLLFSRFFNASRKGSLPDIDVDFEVLNRYKTIDYITQKYGEERVGKVVTYGRMMGRGAIKEVLRVHDACSFSEMNNISDAFPEESKISDELQVLKDAGLDASIIDWTLHHRKKELAEYCYVDDSGAYQGPFAKYFEQARRLEGCLKSAGSHASAIVLADEPLSNICPMIRSATGNDIIAGIEYESLEKLGVVKLDILGTAVLDKIHRVSDILKQPRKRYTH